MCMCVGVHVCMYECMYVCMCVCVKVRTLGSHFNVFFPFFSNSFEHFRNLSILNKFMYYISVIIY